MHARLSLLALAWSIAPNANACDCATMSVQQREQESHVVFVGRVLTHQPLQSVELEVLELFKGNVPRQISVPTGGSDCDFFVKPVEAHAGDEFLVFLTRRE